MSNCIEIADPDTRFFGHEIDVEGLRTLLNRPEIADRRTPPPSYGQEGYDSTVNMAWWFLKGAVTFDDQGVMIRFGCSNSSHTWRDFQGIIVFLGQYMKVSKHVSFRLADEMDNFRLYERYTAVFAPRHQQADGKWSGGEPLKYGR